MARGTDLNDFEARYPDEPAVMHIPVDSPLMRRARLIELARSLPSHLVEFNPGDLPVSVAPGEVPSAGMSAAETIERLGEVNSWMTLRNVESDPDYQALMNALLDHVERPVGAQTGRMLRREGFIFISSAGAVTPFHIDEEHNILIQVEGEKEFTIYSQHDRELASQIDLERFHSGAHRNLQLDPALADRGTTVKMTPGTALYVPPLAPHWVRVTGDTPSLSLSITWRSNASKRMCYLHQINHQLREAGGSPRFPGESPMADQMKIWQASARARLNRITGGR